MSDIKDTKRLDKAQKLMIDWCEKTGKEIKLTPDSALEVFECIADLTKQANEVEPSNYKALPIQNVSGSAFAIAISDGYVTWEYPINIKNTTIDKVHNKICAVLDCEKEPGQILKHYR